MKTIIFYLTLCLFGISALAADKKCHEGECLEGISGYGLDQSEPGDIDFTIAIVNDSAYGIYELVTGNKLGDDFGSTHGILLELLYTGRNELTYGVVYSTNLYTQKESERYQTEQWGGTYDQLFTEENIIKLTLENEKEDRKTYYKVGAGLIELNDQDSNSLLGAAGQQVFLHDLIGSFHPNNIPGDDKIRQGLFVEGEIGKRYIHKLPSGRSLVVSDIKMGAVKSNLEGLDRTSVTTGVDYYYQKYKNSTRYKVGAKLITSSHDFSNRPSTHFLFSLGANKKRYGVELIVSKIISGDLQNYQLYNNDKEVNVTLQFSGKFKNN